MKRIYLILFGWMLALTVQAQLPNGETPFVEGELLVKLSNNSRIDGLLVDFRNVSGVETGLTVVKQLSSRMAIWHLSFDADVVNAYDFKRAISNHPAIVAAQFNHFVEHRATPNDPDFSNQWHHVNANDADIDADLAWDITTGGTTAFGDEIVVCVIEGGNLNHPDLVDNKWVNLQEIPGNGIDDDGNGYVDDYNGWNVQSNDDSGVFSGGHGTQVMGMIGAKGNNDLGVAGVNWDVKIMSVAGENINSEASVVSAYDYALNMRALYNENGGEKGAFVVATNASWGIDNANAANYPIWCAVYDALGEVGVLSCGATANNNVNIDVVSEMPRGCTSPYMVAVTATNDNDVRTFSRYGQTTIDLGAPGEDVWTTSGSAGYGPTSGTSFASPLTAGAIALIYSTPCPSFAALIHADPQAGADYVYQVLMDGTDPVPNLTTETISGGRLNVNNSIQLVLQGCSDSDCFSPFGVALGGDATEGYSISWGGTGSMTGFNVRYREVGAADWNQVNGITETNYTFPELLWCTEYEAQVMAMCADTESGWSALQTWLTDGCCEYPDFDSIAVSDIDENSAMISWASVLAAESYTVVITDEAGNAESFSGIVNTAMMFSDLDPCTMYLIELGLECGDGTMLEAIEVAEFTTMGCGPCTDFNFCGSFGGTNDEWIQRIQLVAIDSNSGDNGGYGDFTMNTEQSTVLDPGGTYTLTLTPGFSGTAFSEIWQAWIDTNQDGEFQANEIIFTSDAGSSDAQSGEFTLAQTSLPGSVRLRVSMKYAGFFGNASPPAPCEEMEFGEVEDYCVEISTNIVNSVSEARGTDWSVFPNPSSGILNVSLPEGMHQIDVLDLTGRVVASSFTNGVARINMEHLSTGIYMVQLITDGIPQATKKVVLQRQ